MRRSSGVRTTRGIIPLIGVVAMLATLIPNPALAGEGSVTRNYSTGAVGSFFSWPCNQPITAGPVREHRGGACFPLTRIEKLPASITVQDAAGLPGWIVYRIMYWEAGWVEFDYGYACGTSVSIYWLPPANLDPGTQMYLQVQLLQSLDFNTGCNKGIFTTGTITFSYTT